MCKLSNGDDKNMNQALLKGIAGSPKIDAFVAKTNTFNLAFHDDWLILF